VKLVLASGSPRRRELIGRLGLAFEVVVSDVDEDAVQAPGPEELTRKLALAKARAVAAVRPDAAVLAADTIVVHDGNILGKPLDAEEAWQTLSRLRGQVHTVITGVALLLPGREPVTLQELTLVHMRDYSDAEIEASIARGECFDKAGAYAIQDETLHPVESYEGCYCNVMGLPLIRTLQLLREAGFKPDTGQLPSFCGNCPAREPQVIEGASRPLTRKEGGSE
jgi:septum formation protein